MEHKRKETKLYKLNKEIKKLQEEQRFEQEEERKKLLDEQNQLEEDKKKHSDEQIKFLRQKEQHKKKMEREIEEMKQEKEAEKYRQKNFYAEMKKFAAKEKKFGVWKDHKSKKELDLEEREKNILLKEKAYKSLSGQLTMQMAIHEEKERIDERKILDKEAEFKKMREELSSKELKFTSAVVELNKEKKDVAEQKKKNDYMLSLLKTKKVIKH